MVLVLNQDYTPITICSVQRAFTLIFLGKADLIEEIKEKSLRSITTKFPFPSVVRINKYVHIPYKRVVMTRQNIFKRDEGKCQYCGTTKELTLDHVIPRSKGGRSTWLNLVTACKKCNSLKGDQSLEKSKLKLSKKPVKPSYISFLRMQKGNYQERWNQYLSTKETM